MKRISIFLLLLCTSLPFHSFSQEIKGDIIWVNASTNATIKFPEDIISVEPGCAPGLYMMTPTGNKLVISPVADKRPPQCLIKVQEGDGKTSRRHTFTVYFQSDDADIDLEKSYIDVHNMDLLTQRVAKVDASKQGLAKADQVVNNTPVQTAAPAAPPVQTAPQQSDAGVPAGIDDIDFGGTKVTRAQLNERVTRKLDLFRQNLEILGTHRAPAQKVIDNIMTFFNNDQGVKVEVRSAGKAPVLKPILNYLNDFSHLPYSAVKIEYSQLQFIGQFQKNPDGTYRGVVCLEQRFIGMKEGKAAYMDVTKKNITITVRVSDLVKDGQTKQFIEVFLGNIALAKEA